MTHDPTTPLADADLREYQSLALWTQIWGPGGLELADSLALAMCLPPESRVLDAGAGSGEITCFLAQRFGWRITTLDLEPPERIAWKARTRGLSGRVEARRGDMLAPDLPAESFDGVFCQGSLEMLGDRRAGGVAALARTLRPGGAFGVAEPMLRRALSLEEQLATFGNDSGSPFLSLEQTLELFQAAGLVVQTAFLHPDGPRFWDEFYAPMLDDGGRLLRPEMESGVIAWKRDRGEHLTIGVLVARRPGGAA